MTLRIFGDAGSGFTLHADNDAKIGWIDGRTLGFRCFADQDAATLGARFAYMALVSWSERLGGAQKLPEIGHAKLKLVKDGAYTWLASGRVPIARLLTPHADVASEGGVYGIELILPRGVGTVAAIGGAQVIYATLVREMPDGLVHPVASSITDASDAAYADASDVA